MLWLNFIVGSNFILFFLFQTRYHVIITRCHTQKQKKIKSE